MPRVRMDRPSGPRAYVGRLRIHGGLTGCALVLLGVARGQRILIELGLALAVDDAHSRPTDSRPGSASADGDPRCGSPTLERFALALVRRCDAYA